MIKSAALRLNGHFSGVTDSCNLFFHINMIRFRCGLTAPFDDRDLLNSSNAFHRDCLLKAVTKASLF